MIEFDLTIQELFMVIQVFVIWAVGVRLSPESLRTYGNGVAPGGLCGEIMRSQHRQWVLDSDPSPGFHLWVPFLNFTQMDTSSHTFANVGRADRSSLRPCTQYWYSCRIWWPPLWDPAVTVLLVGPRTCTLPLVPPVSPVSKLYASPITVVFTPPPLYAGRCSCGVCIQMFRGCAGFPPRLCASIFGKRPSARARIYTVRRAPRGATPVPLAARYTTQ